MNEKNKRSTNVIIGILIVLVILLASFIVCDKILLKKDNSQENSSNIKDNGTSGNIKDDENDSNNDNKENSNNGKDNNNSSNTDNDTKEYQEISISSQLVKKLWDMSGAELTLINGDDDKIIEGFYKNDITIVNNLSDEIKVMLLEKQLEKIGAENNNACYNNYGCDFKYWSANVVANTYDQIFGNDNYIKNKVIGCSNYQNDYSLYKSKNCGGSVGIMGAESNLVKATQSSDEIILYQSVKFSVENANGSMSYYKDYNKTVSTNESDNTTPNYKRIFKKNKFGNYYFYSVEKIK